MSLAETDFRVFLSPDSDLPPDVFFLVHGEDEETGRQSKTFGAHRFVLAAVSPVFRRMFFGPMKETAEGVEVKETTPEAFEAMIKYVYNPPGGETFNLDQISCPQKLFELLTLANKYQIMSLAAMTSDALGSLAITRENMIFTATVAKNYKEAFDDVSTKVLVKCLKFLFDTTSGAGDILSLIKETVEHFPGASLDILRELMDVGNATLQLPGWGSLVFFDTEEHQILTDWPRILAKIPKLGTQWKIIHEFKPPVNLQEGDPAMDFPVLCVEAGNIVQSFLVIGFRLSNIFGLVVSIFVGDDQIDTTPLISQLPKIGEWTRFEISHEEVEGKYFLCFSVGGREVGRREADPDHGKLTDVEIYFRRLSLPGFVRRLVVLEKQ